LVLIGVNTQGAPKIVVGLRQTLDRIKGFQFRADDQSPVNPSFLHLLSDLSHVWLKFRVVQMTM
jgi:hypothetical protein